MKFLILITLFISTLLSHEKLEKVSLQLQWLDQFQFAGYYIAKEKGFYKDVGLDVEIKKYNIGDNVTQKVLNNESQYGTGRTSLLIDISNGKKIYLMSAIFQSSPLVLISLKSSGINTIKDFKNKTVMLTGSESSAGIFGMISSRGISNNDMKIIKSAHKLQNLIDKKVDIISAYTSNQMYILNQKKIPINIFHPKDYGFNFYSDILFTNQEEYQNHYQRVHNFNNASLKGWEYAFNHIEEAVELLLKKYNSQNKTREDLLFEAQELKKLAYFKTKKIGKISKEKMNSIYDIYRIMRFIKNPIDFDESIVDDSHNKLTLTQKEKQYISTQKELKVCVKSDLFPLDGFKNNSHTGIVGDIFGIISNKLNLNLKYLTLKNRQELIQNIENNKCDIISILSKSHNSKQFFVTDTLIKDSFSILTNLDESFIRNEDLLKNKKLLTRYPVYKDYLLSLYPYLNIKIIDNLDEIVKLVNEKKAYGIIELNKTSDFIIQKYGYGNLKVNGFIAKESPLNAGIGIINTKPELLSIFNKVIRTITPKALKNIETSWQNPVYITKIDYTSTWQILGISLIILFIFIYKNKQISKSNNELNKQKELYNTVLENTLDGVTIFDPNTGKRIDCNQQAVKIFGYASKEEMLKIRPNEASPEFQPDGKKSDEKAKEIFKFVLKNKIHTYEWLHVKTSGEEFLIEATLTSLNVSNKNIIYAVWKDITQRKKIELKINHQAQMIEQIHESVISTDLEGYITYWNEGSYQILQYSSDEMIGEHISKIYLEEDLASLKANIQKLNEKGKHETIVRLVKKSKEVILAELSLSFLKNDKGETIAMVGYSKDITKRMNAEKELLNQKNILLHQANHDALTNLPNRTLFNDRLEQSIQKAKRNKTEFALFFIDLDKFKQINDSLGHDVGDKVIINIAKLLRKTIREKDTLARLGGDEFTIIIEDLTKVQDAAILAQKIINTLIEPTLIDNKHLYVTCSIGISLYPKDSNNIQNLLKYADTAMYKAKDEGRNTYQFYSKQMTQLVFEQVTMEESLRNAIKNEDFVVYYQPQIDAHTNKLVGMEALVRWEHSTMGLVSPNKFIPLAEETGMIVEIDKLVMQLALQQIILWKKDNLHTGILSLNLSMKQLKDKNFTNIIEKTIEKYNFNPEWLGLEVTEGYVMQNPEEAIVKLKKLSDLGIKIAIDDFGIGYSSLSYLKRLPVSTLKIDQSFIRDIPEDEEDSAIVNAIIALSESLNLEVIAEGVENEKQLLFLLQNNCHHIQGYYYAKPMPANEMKNYIEKMQ